MVLFFKRLYILKLLINQPRTLKKGPFRQGTGSVYQYSTVPIRVLRDGEFPRKTTLVGTCQPVIDVY